VKKQKSLSTLKFYHRLVAFTGGAMLLQTSTCTLDETLQTDLTSLVVQVLLTAMTGIV